MRNGHHENPSVVLLSMPWASPARPSIALGILSSMCGAAGVPVRTLYPNMDIYPLAGLELAHTFTSNRALFGLSEHLFACDIFGRKALQSDQFIQACVRENPAEAKISFEILSKLRDVLIPEFLDQVCRRILELEPQVVGFTATFNQLMASLALAQRLKAARRELRIILGGAAVDEEMGIEIHRALPDTLDHVFLGEAEAAFQQFLAALTEGRDAEPVPGMTSGKGGQVVGTPGSPLPDLNQSPCPDYDDYFVERERIRVATGLNIEVETLPFEGSRGCWWGAKNHCVFCGINKDLMVFREKDPERVVTEIERLARRYRITNLMATDLIISRRHRKEIFQRIKDLDLDIECFYETRADLSKEELELLATAGIWKIQPGIESLSTDLLYLMKKNTTGIKQVQFLRWCREYGIDATYNIICAFPGDRAEWYLEMAEFIPRVVHLQPPRSLHQAEMHRFSPLFEQRKQLGVEEYGPRKDYLHNFPPGLLDPLKVAYFFSYQSSQVTPVGEYLPQLSRAVKSWMQSHQQLAPRYEYTIGPGFVKIFDSRTEQPLTVELSGLAADVFLLSDEVHSFEFLRRKLSAHQTVSDNALETVCQHLVSADLLMREGDNLLTLPTSVRARTTTALTNKIGANAVREVTKLGA